MSGLDQLDHRGADDEVQRFWTVARTRARITRLPGYLPQSALALVPPPTWSFGRTAEQADALLALVLAGTKTATASSPDDYDENEPGPEVGTLGIVLDGDGRPRALVETTEVTVVPFDEVDREHARLEGEGDLSLDHWREVHRRFFGTAFAPRMLVVLERFRVLYQE